MILWVTEAIPLFATSSMVILLLVLLLSDVSGKLDWAWGIADGFARQRARRPTPSIFNTLANKVLILFLGGFFLAVGAAKFGVDRNLAAIMLKPFGTKPSMVLLGLMLITGILSMWMSNTATTATIMAVVLPMMHRLPKERQVPHRPGPRRPLRRQHRRHRHADRHPAERHRPRRPRTVGPPSASAASSSG